VLSFDVDRQSHPCRLEMDEVVQAVEAAKKEWDQTFAQTREHVKEIEGCGKSGRGTEEANSLPRLNGAAQDGMAVLRSLQFKLDLLAQQLPTEQEALSAQAMLKSWKEQYQRYIYLFVSSRSFCEYKKFGDALI